MKGARQEIDDEDWCSCTAHCFVADPVRRAAHPELLLAPAFWVGERPLPGAEELLVALLGAVCLEELDGRWAIGAACKQTAHLVRPWTFRRQSCSGIRIARVTQPSLSLHAAGLQPRDMDVWKECMRTLSTVVSLL